MEYAIFTVGNVTMIVKMIVRIMRKNKRVLISVQQMVKMTVLAASPARALWSCDELSRSVPQDQFTSTEDTL
jgi:hypothetical protein